MIVVDTSALYAILSDETEAETFKRILSVEVGICLSAPTWVEAVMVCRSRLPHGLERLERLASVLSMERQAFDARQADLAAEAFRRYGRGSGHPARLNFGDCFSYALARSLDAALLYKGDDFVHTDIRSAVQP